MTLPYKLICLDLDGTLLISGEQIDPVAVAVLREIEQMGVSIAIVTGRSAFDARDYAKSISDNAYFIGSNGSVVGKVDQNENISVSPMKKETIRALFDISSELGASPFLYTDKNIYILNTEFTKRAIFHNSWHDWINSRYLHIVNSKDQFEAYVLNRNVKVTKANLLLSNEELIRKAIQLFNRSESFSLERFSDFGVIEVVEKGMNKSLGIDILSKVLNIDRKEIVAFGDSENDREMMLYVGYAVAMGNAVQSINDIADVIADTNRNKGVAKELVKIFGIKKYQF